MQIYEVYSVYDKKAFAFNIPLFMPTEQTILRRLSLTINNATSENVLYYHTEDFALYHIGTFNDNSGVFTPDSTPKFITELAVLKKGELVSCEKLK
ncbi:MAG: nonstructural protein [Arizlama microvirus]|nr:MAG: nonstructural protein [Arizlama microvirus]